MVAAGPEERGDRTRDVRGLLDGRRDDRRLAGSGQRAKDILAEHRVEVEALRDLLLEKKVLGRAAMLGVVPCQVKEAG